MTTHIEIDVEDGQVTISEENSSGETYFIRDTDSVEDTIDQICIRLHDYLEYVQEQR